jgi:formate dehydrogenase major subunit
MPPIVFAYHSGNTSGARISKVWAKFMGLKILGDWPVLRQLRAGARGTGREAMSGQTKRLRARHLGAEVSRSICPYCGVGCGQLIYHRDGELVNIEGDPDSPISRGRLCPKGSDTFELHTHPGRLKTVKYRRPYAAAWEEISLDQAMDMVEQRLWESRERTFVEEQDGQLLMQTKAVGHLGGATLDNEENYLIKKLFCGGLGMVCISNQARICHSSTVPALGTSFGRGGATTAQQSLADSDAILIMGSSMAENHPVGFQWVMEAREKNGAIVIHVDPRFTRTSAMSDIWVPLRAGTDILFLGALIHYVLSNERIFREYVVNYTNAPMILRDDYRDTEDLNGLFSGWDAQQQSYSPETWLYEGSPKKDHNGKQPGHHEHGGGHGKDRGGEAGDPGEYHSDPTLQHPRCVYQVLKKHFERYTPEILERYAGVPRDVFLKTAEAFTSASGREKTGAICYAVGWTQHSDGVQTIRAAAILQLLLGNIGRPGGGILALRGHPSIQGSTDIPTLYDILPGYLPMPFFEKDANDFSSYVQKHRSRTGLWHSFDSYFVSLMKAWYGDAAQAKNGWGFDFLPRVSGDHSQLGYWLEMADGKMEGLFVMGQNPAVGAPNGRLQRSALAKLKWLVVRDMEETETASFWYASPEIERKELKTEEIATEVFLFPAAGSAEKDGTFTNTQRLIQFREKAVDPPGDARSESWFMYHLGQRIKRRANGLIGRRYAPLQNLTWAYRTKGAHAEPEITGIMKEINGWTMKDHRQVESYHALKDDGSTACGCWIYSGIFPGETTNKPNGKASADFLGHGWGYSWPSDIRILYNRASADPEGRPWSERKKLIWWDEEKQQWTGVDRPDFEVSKRPDYRPPQGATGMSAIPGDKPFILHPDGAGWLYVTSGLKDGPLPTHYEPLESPLHNPLYPEHDTDPAADRKERPGNRYARVGDPRFPHVLTTYRLTEQHTSGAMSRTLGHLAELQPALFCEVSPELAGEAGLVHGEYATISSPRATVEARVLITPRMHTLWADGRRIHQVGLPYHWGYIGKSKGDVVNDLLAISEEPNVRIMETKALVCRIEPGRRRRGKALTEWEKKLQGALV